MKTWRPYSDCACRCTEREWVEMCLAHRAEHDDLHLLAQWEHEITLAGNVRRAHTDDNESKELQT
jgi:hypothetical protein